MANYHELNFKSSEIGTLMPGYFHEYGGALVVWPGMPFPNLDGRIHQSLVFTFSVPVYYLLKHSLSQYQM